jgi:hypothetical protein
MEHSLVSDLAVSLGLVLAGLSLLTWFLREFLTEAGKFWKWVKNWYSCL